MTLAMPDSIHVADLPPGYPAYLGYADGLYQTAGDLSQQHPAAYLVILTVTGLTVHDADGIDCEPGNPDAAGAADWCGRKLVQAPGSRPVIYASIEGAAGYGMRDVLTALSARNIPRTAVRLLSAHYGAGNHICGPATCKLGPAATVEMDGTQWTNTYSGTGGNLIDMSELRDDFFTAPTPPEDPMYLVIPNVPGRWLTFGWDFDTVTKTLTGRGMGTSGQYYEVVSTDGGHTFASPVLVGGA